MANRGYGSDNALDFALIAVVAIGSTIGIFTTSGTGWKVGSAVFAVLAWVAAGYYFRRWQLEKRR